MKLFDIMKSFLRSPGRNPTQYAFRVTTNGSGDMAMVAGCDFDGAFAAPTRSTATYTVDIGAFKQLRSCMMVQNGALTQTVTSITPNPSLGTIVIVCSAAIVSKTIEFQICVDL